MGFSPFLIIVPLLLEAHHAERHIASRAATPLTGSHGMAASAPELEVARSKDAVDAYIQNTIDGVLVLRFGKEDDAECMQLDDVLRKAAPDISRFARVVLADAGSPDLQVYIKYFDITLLPATIFFFNATHMKMDSGSPDHSKWVGAFHSKQDFIDVVETIFRGAMRGKLIVTCPLPPDRVPKYQLLYKNF